MKFERIADIYLVIGLILLALGLGTKGLSSSLASISEMLGYLILGVSILFYIANLALRYCRKCK